jgi:Zn-dependent protease
MSPPYEPASAGAGQTLIEDVMKELGRSKRGRFATTALFTLSLVAFAGVLLLQGQYHLMDGVSLVGVLMFHELGHAVAMRAFGYSDVKIFFVPFLGAVTAGLRQRAPAWQQALVLLAGPLPGLLVGAALLLAPPQVRSALPGQLPALLVGLNVLNLLPIEPLDGGRLVGLLLFGGMPRLRALFSIGTGVAFVVIANLGSTWTGGIVGAFAGAAVLQWRAASMADHARGSLKRSWADLPAEIVKADRELLWCLFEKDPAVDTGPSRFRARQIANRMRVAYEMLRFVPVARAIAVPVGLAFLAVTTVAGARLASNMKGSTDTGAFAQSFEKACLKQCRASVDAVGQLACPRVCECRLRDTQTYATPEYLAAEFDLSTQRPSDAFRQRLEHGTALCSADLWDAQFSRSCEQGCGARVPFCHDYCKCVLTGLRGAGDRAASTLWLMKNLDGPRPTPEGSQRARALQQVCAMTDRAEAARSDPPDL